VLEIGTGSGYAAAILARVAKQVFTIERIDALAAAATERLAQLGFGNVKVRLGDGSLGWPAHAPFDAIVVAAGGPDVPPAQLAQLAVGGRLVMPIGTGRAQELIRVTRVASNSYQHEDLGGVLFVPLIGAQGWPKAAVLPRVPSGTIPQRAGPLLTSSRRSTMDCRAASAFIVRARASNTPTSEPDAVGPSRDLALDLRGRPPWVQIMRDLLANACRRRTRAGNGDQGLAPEMQVRGIMMSPLHSDDDSAAEPRTIGKLCIGGDWACAHGDFAALRNIAQQLASAAAAEPLHCELIALADACLDGEDRASVLWHRLRDRLYPMAQA
jgi:SAM-dependent methyltransferase